VPDPMDPIGPVPPMALNSIQSGALAWTSDAKKRASTILPVEERLASHSRRVYLRITKVIYFVKEISMRLQSQSCLNSKYLWFVSRQCASLDAGTDVNTTVQ
jgi:hypothetical protein